MYEMKSGLREDGLDAFAGDVGEAEIAAFESVDEAFVVEAEEVEDSGLDVVDVDGVFGDLHAEFVGGAVGDAGFDAAAGHPHGEGLGVVIASAAASECGAGFNHGGASEFAAPDDKGVFEQSAFFKVFDKGGGGLIGLFAFGFESAFDVAVVIPGAVVTVDEADAAFDETSCEQAVVGVGAFAGFGAVFFEGGFGFLGDVDGFGGGGLHSVGEFVGVDAGKDFGIADGVELFLVERFQEVEGFTLGRVVDAVGVGEVEYGIACAAEGYALVGGGHESASPVGGACAGAGAGVEHDEAGEVFGFGAESVGDPGTHAGSAGSWRTGVEEDLGGGVIELVGVYGFDDSEVVDDAAEIGEHLGEFGSGLAMLFEFEGGGHHGGVLIDEGVALSFEDGFGHAAAVVFGEERFVIEEVELAGGTGHEEVDDAFGFGSVVGGSGCHRILERVGGCVC